MHAVAVVDRIAKYSGVLSWMRRRCIRGVTILMYHKVLPRHLVPRYPLPNLVVEQSSFDSQMAWLAKHFEVLTVRDAMASAVGHAARRRPVACVTFDDGYRDNFDHAAPVLESHGLPGTFFITTGFAEGRPMWFDHAAHAWRCDPVAVVRQAVGAAPEYGGAFAGISVLGDWMSALKQIPTAARETILSAVDQPPPAADEVFGAMAPEQIRLLAQRGHEIGAHSVTHPILTTLDDASLRAELQQSRAAIAAWTGRPVDGFCYPNGNCDDRVAQAARDAGYRYACMVRRGMATESAERMQLPRRAIMSSSRRESPESFEAEVIGWHDLLRHSRQRISLAAPNRKP